MIDLLELCKTSYETAVSKGWWDKPRTYAALTLLMQSEISEALEDYRNGKSLTAIWYENVPTKAPRCHCGADHGEGCEVHHYIMADGRCTCTVDSKKPCGIPTEIADVIIRIADFCGHEKLELFPVAGLEDLPFDDALAMATAEISKAYIQLTQGVAVLAGNPQDSSHRWGIASSLSMAVQRLVNMCLTNGIDIEKAIVEKATFNKTRPNRHGNKKI